MWKTPPLRRCPILLLRRPLLCGACQHSVASLFLSVHTLTFTFVPFVADACRTPWWFPTAAFNPANRCSRLLLQQATAKTLTRMELLLPLPLRLPLPLPRHQPHLFAAPPLPPPPPPLLAQRQSQNKSKSPKPNPKSRLVPAVSRCRAGLRLTAIKNVKRRNPLFHVGAVLQRRRRNPTTAATNACGGGCPAPTLKRRNPSSGTRWTSDKRAASPTPTPMTAPAPTATATATTPVDCTARSRRWPPGCRRT